MKELLLSKGWIINHECHCSGIHRIEFAGISFPGLIVKIYPGRGTWKATRKGRKIGNGTSDNIEIFINGLAE